MVPCRKSWPGKSEGKVEIFLSVRRIALQLSEHMREKGKKIRGKEGKPEEERAGKKSKTQAGFNLEASHRRWSDLYLLQ